MYSGLHLYISTILYFKNYRKRTYTFFVKGIVTYLVVCCKCFMHVFKLIYRCNKILILVFFIDLVMILKFILK